MLIVFPRDVQARLDAIEAMEGMPAEEVVYQAVDVWSRLDRDGRAILGVAAMQLVVERIRSGS